MLNRLAIGLFLLIFSIVVSSEEKENIAQSTESTEVKTEQEKKNNSLSIEKENIVYNTEAVVTSRSSKETLQPSHDLEVKEWIMMIALIVSSLSLMLSAYSMNKVSRHRNEDKFLQEIDGFWFKEIVTPKVIQPVLTFQDSQLEEFQKIQPSQGSELSDAQKNKAIEQFLKELTILSFSIETLSSVPHGANFAKQILIIHEELENALNGWLYLKSSDDLIFNDEQSELPSEEDKVPVQQHFLQARVDTVSQISKFRDIFKSKGA